MRLRKGTVTVFAVATAVGLGLLQGPDSFGQPQAVEQPLSTGSIVKPMGTVMAIHGNAIALKTDSGPDASILVQQSTRLVRTAPGRKDLKDAMEVQLQDLQVGDRMLVRGRISDDANSIVALSIIVMKRTDLAERETREREDWQKRGVGGVVTAIDPTAATITVVPQSFAGSKTLAINVSKATTLRRYANDSVKFEDAKPGTFEQIRPGDQILARGTRNTDGNELAAEEIVSGSFRNIAGIIASVDAEKKTIKVAELATEKPLSVRIVANSQLNRLSDVAAQQIALRLKGTATPPAAAQPDHPTASPDSGLGGLADVQRLLQQMPSITLSDLRNGDAIVVVAMPGGSGSEATVIKLLAGVKPILTASPNGSGAAMLLSPWHLPSSSTDAEGP